MSIFLEFCAFYLNNIFSFREYHHFVLMSLKLLCTHLSLAVAGGLTSSLLGSQAKPLRILLFRLVDTEIPQVIKQVFKFFQFEMSFSWILVYLFFLNYSMF